MHINKKIQDNWELCMWEPEQPITKDIIKGYMDNSNNTVQWYECEMPSQVGEILLKHKVIDDPVYTHDFESCKWIADKDWIYKCYFKYREAGTRQYIHFGGLDTIADIYLNGCLIGESSNMFLHLRVDVTGKLNSENILIIHFKSPMAFVRKAIDEMPETWKGKVKPFHLMRKTQDDFTSFLGANPYFIPIGVYRDIQLEIVDEAEIIDIQFQYTLNSFYEKAEIQMEAELFGDLSKTTAEIRLLDMERIIVFEDIMNFDVMNNREQVVKRQFVLSNPKLWWPKLYGLQYRYTIEVKLIQNGKMIDVKEKTVGFREIKMEAPFDFMINKMKVKLWGTNFEPLTGGTHVWDRKRGERLLELAELSNINCIRVWGGGDLFPDWFYDWADQKGILLWQEFFFNAGMFPDSDSYRRECIREAAWLVKHLKHHPSILFWCGGNESMMAPEFNMPKEKYIGMEIFTEDLSKVCKDLDPDRWYVPNSPYEGDFYNDPLKGDTHGYNHRWLVRGAEYPIMLTENTRVSTPSLNSLKKLFNGQALWPDDFEPRVTGPQDSPIPSTWKCIMCPPIDIDYTARMAETENLYDAKDLESLVYKLGTGHGLHLKFSIEALRRGRVSDGNENGIRTCMGQFQWKFNDPWPQIYCGMVDHFMEPVIAFYYFKRACEPLQVSFDVRDGVFLWVVNDTGIIAQGQLRLFVFDMLNNRMTYQKEKQVIVPSGESQLLMDLDELPRIDRQCIVYAELIDDNGNSVAQNFAYLEIERKLQFPDAKLDLCIEGDELTIQTDKFARSIELSGNCNGDMLGWVFEDNYFDLLPGQKKRIKILGDHKTGGITAKPFFSEKKTTVVYRKKP